MVRATNPFRILVVESLENGQLEYWENNVKIDRMEIWCENAYQIVMAVFGNSGIEFVSRS
jgi:hypothetical protein